MREYGLANLAPQAMDRFVPRHDGGRLSAAQQIVIASEARQSMDRFVPRDDFGSLI